MREWRSAEAGQGARRVSVAELAILAVLWYALTTAALVVFLRIALKRFQAVVDDRETRVAASLETHVHNLGVEFTSAEAAMRELSTNASLTLTSWSRELAETRRVALHNTLEFHRRTITDEAAALQAGIAGVTMEVHALHAAVKDIQGAINGVAKGVDLAGGKLVGSLDEMARRTQRSTVAADETFEQLRKQAQNINIPEDLLTSRVDALVKRSASDLEGLSAALANAVRQIQQRLQTLTTILTEIPGRANAEAALADLSERMRGVGKSLGRVEAALLAAGTSTYALSTAAAKAAAEVQGLEDAKRSRPLTPLPSPSASALPSVSPKVLPKALPSAPSNSSSSAMPVVVPSASTSTSPRPVPAPAPDPPPTPVDEDATQPINTAAVLSAVLRDARTEPRSAP